MRSYLCTTTPPAFTFSVGVHNEADVAGPPKRPLHFAGPLLFPLYLSLEQPKSFSDIHVILKHSLYYRPASTLFSWNYFYLVFQSSNLSLPMSPHLEFYPASTTAYEKDNPLDFHVFYLIWVFIIFIFILKFNDVVVNVVSGEKRDIFLFFLGARAIRAASIVMYNYTF